MITEWNKPDPQDRVWLTYSTNYLFRTNNVRRAIDPLTFNWRIKDAPKVDVVRDLSPQRLILTHLNEFGRVSCSACNFEIEGIRSGYFSYPCLSGRKNLNVIGNPRGIAMMRSPILIKLGIAVLEALNNLTHADIFWQSQGGADKTSFFLKQAA